MNKNTKKLLILGGVIIAIILLIIADKSFRDRKAEEAELDSNTETENAFNSEFEDENTDDVNDDETGNVNDAETDDVNDAETGDTKKAEVGNVNDAEAGDTKNSESEDVNDSKDNNETDSASDDSTGNNNSNLAEDSYEKWLAAGVVTGVSMHYMDFELEGIYLASNTTLNAHDDSKGVYVVFKNGGETITIHSVPLKEERSKAGTIDLSTENFGLATFDVVEVKDADLEKCEEVSLENISALLNQLMLVTLYEH